MTSFFPFRSLNTLTHSKTVPEENRRCKADNIQQHSLLCKYWIANMDTTTFVNTTQMVKDSCLQGTRKIGCHATIRVKTFILYPEYAIGDVTGKSARQIKLLQESQLELLQKAIAKGDDICKICLLTIRGCTLRSPHQQFRRICTKNPPPSFRPNLSTGCCRNNRHE